MEKEGRHDGQEERVLTTTNMKVKGFIQRGGRGEALGFSPLPPKNNYVIITCTSTGYTTQ